MPKCYSYQRFSSLKQGNGDSIRRQESLREAYLLRNPDLILDDTLRLTDRGKSAFRSKNAKEGALAGFLAAVQAGQVEPGEVLLIENLDRLSRDKIGVALSLFIGILNAGVEIVTLAPERRYTQDSVNDLAGLLEPIISMQRAYEESEVKSSRGSSKWQARRDGIANGKKIVHSRKVLPAWIAPNTDRTDFVLVPEVAATARQIFEMALAGYGVRAIVARLIKADIKPIGQKPTWHGSYIKYILNNRAAIGEFQAYRRVNGKRVQAGEPVPNYFPPIIDVETFERAQAGLKARVPRAKKGPGRKESSGPVKTRKSAGTKNLFKGLILDARDGRTFNYLGRDKPGNTYRYLVNSGAMRKEKDATFITFPYQVFEDMFLLATKELAPEDLAPVNGNAKAELARLNIQLAEVNAAINETKLKVQDRGRGTTVNVLLDLLVDLERQRNDVQAALVTLRLQASGHAVTTLKAAQGLVEQLEACATDEEREDLRERLKGRIKGLVDRIYLLVWKGKKAKHALTQIHFTNGSIRLIYLNDKDPLNSRTFLNPPTVPERDLRNYRENPWVLDDAKG